ncbi:MAG TPA: serine/threonine-protein kinase [Polyangiales bacterium]|nr:serine/threonine-protein kinase [Polyangiales bacterium]
MARFTDIDFESQTASATSAPSRTLRASACLALAAPAVLAAVWFGPHAGSDLFTPSVSPAVLVVLAAAALAYVARLIQRRRSGRDQLLGAYRLDEKIGEGGMGIVYKASHTLLQRPAAIKVLPAKRAGERDRRRFEREVQLTSRLTHPNTISIYDYGRTPTGSFYYAMEYVDGCDLQTLVERDGPQDPARVARVLAQLASALSEAHRTGLIHRDIKPANVMLCERGGVADVVKVLDFGLIKEIDGGRGADTEADSERLVGTPLYMSPEALTEPNSVDARSDLYAVGALGYFLLTGQPPFAGRTVLEVCSHHLRSTPMTPSERLGAELPQELEALILACLAKSPEDRPESAAALERALLDFAASWTQERAERWWYVRDARHSAIERIENLARFIESNQVLAA